MCKSKGPTKPAGKVKASDGGEVHSCAPSDPSLIWPARKSCWADGLTVLRCSVVSQAPGSHQTLTLCVCVLRAPWSMHAMTRKIVNYAWRE